MAPKFVAPYRKSGKNDDNDAEAICGAVCRPNMRFAPIKSVQPQADLSRHRVRQGFVFRDEDELRRAQKASIWARATATFRGIDRKWFDVHDHIWQALKTPRGMVTT